MTCNVIVTGVSGFIGSHLVERLFADGYTVTVLDNFSTGRLDNLSHVRKHSCLTIHEVDVAPPELIQEFFAGVDWVLHLASLADIVPSIQQPHHYHRTNVHGTMAVVEAARKSGVMCGRPGGTQPCGRACCCCSGAKQFSAQARP